MEIFDEGEAAVGAWEVVEESGGGSGDAGHVVEFGVIVCGGVCGGVWVIVGREIWQSTGLDGCKEEAIGKVVRDSERWNAEDENFLP